MSIKTEYSDELNDCKIQFEYYTGYKYIFKYTLKGKEKRIVVNIVENDNGVDLELNGEIIYLPKNSLRDCNDVDDCGIVIGKHLIKDHDDEIQMSFVHSHFESFAPIITLTKDWEYKSYNEEDLTWTLNLYANRGLCVSEYEFWEVLEEDIEKVKEWISKKNRDELYKYMFDNCSSEIIESIDLFGDTSNEQITVEVLDDNGEEVGCIPFPILEENVYNYPSYNRPVVDINKHPKYLLFTCDYMKRGYTTYKVPKDFNILGLRFISNNIINNNLILCDSFGDTVTSIWSFRYCGHLFECDDFGDGGNYGGKTIYLYEWDDTEKRYEEVDHM
jgi:hypothetical protein